MGRSSAVAIAALMGLLLTGCGGALSQTGVSLPNATTDDAQTVSDAADALVAHRSSASQNARAAIGVADGFGSFVRDLSDDEQFLSGFARARRGGRISLRDGFARASAQVTPATAGRVFSASQLIMRPSIGDVSAFCQSSAGADLKGIPSLDESFGWQSGAYSGGTRTSNGDAFSTWSATATGAAVLAPIGDLGIARNGDESCPMIAPALAVSGARASNAFSIPMTLTYRNGKLWDVNVSGGAFSDGERLDVTTSPTRRSTISGVITNGPTELASFRENTRGDGTLTITSTGAQYKIADWVVVGI
jgi:hypothetical protein